jgi:hypothetical protein
MLAYIISIKIEFLDKLIGDLFFAWANWLVKFGLEQILKSKTMEKYRTFLILFILM